MSWFKRLFKRHVPRKRTLYKVVVSFDNRAPSGNSVFPHIRFSKRIFIPDGCKFKVGYAERPRVIDCQGNVVKEWRWKAGFEVTYEYFYYD